MKSPYFIFSEHKQLWPLKCYRNKLKMWMRVLKLQKIIFNTIFIVNIMFIFANKGSGGLSQTNKPPPQTPNLRLRRLSSICHASNQMLWIWNILYSLTAQFLEVCSFLMINEHICKFNQTVDSWNYLPFYIWLTIQYTMNLNCTQASSLWNEWILK